MRGDGSQRLNTDDGSASSKVHDEKKTEVREDKYIMNIAHRLSQYGKDGYAYCMKLQTNKDEQLGRHR